MKSRNPSLIGIVARRVIAFSLLAMILQIGVVFADYWFDDDELSVLMLQEETETLSTAIATQDGDLTFKPNHELKERYLERHGPGAIYVRVRTASARFSSPTARPNVHSIFFRSPSAHRLSGSG